MKEKYVDMGNGVLWATSNITRDANGNYKLADNPEDFGCYFSWGDVVGHNSTEYDDDYEFSEDNYSSGASGNGHSLTTDIQRGDSTYDAAAATLGGNWRMPTFDELNYLVTSCNPTWTTMNGVNGELFTNPNDSSKTLFFPAAGSYYGTGLYNRESNGVYWSTKYNNSVSAYGLAFNSIKGSVYGCSSCFSRSVRPVVDKNNIIKIKNKMEDNFGKKNEKVKDKKILSSLKKIFNKDDGQFSAERAWLESTYGVGVNLSTEERIKNKQCDITRTIKSKFRYSQMGCDGNLNYSSYHCVIDIEEDLSSYKEEILKPFIDNGFKVINLSDRVAEIKEENVFLISWKDIFKRS